MSKINTFLEKNISKILGIFIVLQPILDLISGISNNFLNISFSLSSIIRIIFLITGIFYLVFIADTKYKKYNKIYLGLLTFYFITFILSIFVYKDINAFSYEIKNSILFFFFPMTLLVFINLFEEYDIKFNIKYLVIAFTIYIIFIFFPNIIGLGFNSYLEGKSGFSGWFNSANAISSIISLLLPIMIIYFKDKFNYKTFILIIMFIYSILTIGTKVPLLSLTIIILFNIIYLVYYLYKNKDYKKISYIFITLCFLIVLSIIFIPKTTFYKNIKIHTKFLGINNVSDVMTLNSIDRLIFSDRLSFLERTKTVYNNSNLTSKLIGIGYIENYSTDSVNTKIIEIDYYDIYYRHGILGFIIYILPIIPCLYTIIFKRKINDIKDLNLSICTLLILLLALFSGHIFTVPNVSIFVIVIFIINLYRNKVIYN